MNVLINNKKKNVKYLANRVLVLNKIEFNSSENVDVTL